MCPSQQCRGGRLRSLPAQISGRKSIAMAQGGERVLARDYAAEVAIRIAEPVAMT
jgi:hypothetical protein